MKNLALIMALGLSLFFVTPALAEKSGAPAPAPTKLKASEKADIARIEAYLNDLKSVSANFLQISDGGNFRHGSILIQRPNKMRVVYDAPNRDLIVADGSFLNIWDSEMQQQSTVPLGSSIADFILRENIKLSGDVTITRYARYPAKIEVSLVSNKEPGEGELTLVFEDKPLKLRQWRVLDPQGHTTGVNLENAREGVIFPDGSFSFTPQNVGKSAHSPPSSGAND